MTNKLTLYGDYISPYAVTAAFALLEKGLAWEFQHVNILQGGARSLEHLERHPFGKIPVLDIVNDQEKKLRIYESRAIARYIAGVYAKEGNPLLPEINDVEAMAAFEMAASVEVCYFSPAAWKFCSEMIIKPLLGSPASDTKAIPALWNELEDVLKAMNGILASRPYLAGAEFTLADVWSMPWVSQLVDLSGADVVFDNKAYFEGWWKRVNLRPAWIEAEKLMNDAFDELRQK